MNDEEIAKVKEAAAFCKLQGQDVIMFAVPLKNERFTFSNCATYEINNVGDNWSIMRYDNVLSKECKGQWVQGDNTLECILSKCKHVISTYTEMDAYLGEEDGASKFILNRIYEHLDSEEVQLMLS